LRLRGSDGMVVESLVRITFCETRGCIREAASGRFRADQL
jgi:hypothetical protein